MSDARLDRRAERAARRSGSSSSSRRVDRGVGAPSRQGDGVTGGRHGSKRGGGVSEGQSSCGSSGGLGLRGRLRGGQLILGSRERRHSPPDWRQLWQEFRRRRRVVQRHHWQRNLGGGGRGSAREAQRSELRRQSGSWVAVKGSPGSSRCLAGEAQVGEDLTQRSDPRGNRWGDRGRVGDWRSAGRRNWQSQRRRRQRGVWHHRGRRGVVAGRYGERRAGVCTLHGLHWHIRNCSLRVGERKRHGRRVGN